MGKKSSSRGEVLTILALVEQNMEFLILNKTLLYHMQLAEQSLIEGFPKAALISIRKAIAEANKV